MESKNYFEQATLVLKQNSSKILIDFKNYYILFYK